MVSAKIGGNAMVWHFRFGYVVFALLAFRLLWGLVGGRWSRFASFVYAPGTRAALPARPVAAPTSTTTSATTRWAACRCLRCSAFLALQVATGLVADDEIATVGPLNRFVSGAIAGQATHWHKDYGQWILLALVALHVAAIVYYLLRKKQQPGAADARRRQAAAGRHAGGDRHGAATRLLALLLAAAVRRAAWPGSSAWAAETGR